MMRFTFAFDHFSAHDDIIAQIPGGAKAPDAALKLFLPAQAVSGSFLRAPFIAEVRSSSYSRDPSSELETASPYMRTIYADYLFIEKKRQDGSFPAAAVLWRRGAQSAPLLGGEPAAFVSAQQSFGTGELSDETITCLRNGGGHYPGVPNNISFDAVAHPADIVIPKADILQRVMRQDGTLHYQRRGLGNIPVSDAQGRPVFDFPKNGPDHVISLQTLRDRLDAAYLA